MGAYPGLAQNHQNLTLSSPYFLKFLHVSLQLSTSPMLCFPYCRVQFILSMWLPASHLGYAPLFMDKIHERRRPSSIEALAQVPDISCWLGQASSDQIHH
ncbi:unnamed protein product [Arabis nemorensis]|uniref:Uncharacterized protein n=1 Tax=Arabis nemorensis TaxID=586526 RepID=A0A565C3Z2_9BRAS|nr:unnamed protein product [Arabis nemorensis]